MHCIFFTKNHSPIETNLLFRFTVRVVLEVMFAYEMELRLCLCYLIQLNKTEEKKDNNREKNKNLKEIDLKICEKRRNKFRENYQRYLMNQL